MGVWVVLIALRLVWLQVVEHDYYRQRAVREHTSVIPVSPIRGELRDRHGVSLAISLKAESLFATPPSFYPDYRAGKGEGERTWGDPDLDSARRVADRLGPELDQPPAVVLEKLLRHKPFVWIQRQLPVDRAATIKALKLDGVDFLPESKRYYPRGSLACQVLGFVNIDGVGQLGIERAYNQELTGKPGERIAPRDARGHLLEAREDYVKLPVNGSTLQLTLDASIQHLVEAALEEGMEKVHPISAYAVVVDPFTGQILAMAGTPSFDPNQLVPARFLNRNGSSWSDEDKEAFRQELERQKAARKVHPVEDSYEPGSVMKIFTVASALEERKVRLGEPINCEGGSWWHHGARITDDRHFGVLTMEEVLWHSSNIGAAKIGTRLDPAVHYQYLRQFGFGEPTGLNFPGETSGRLLAPDRWSGTTQQTMCYGYGLSVTPLQILMAGCALANGGKLMRPYLVRRVINDHGAVLAEYHPVVRGQVISEETSDMMKEILKGVILNGTARRAKLDGGVEAFGKTGTARKLIDGKYDPRRHYASFMGFFPADRPQYGILFMLDDPEGGHLEGGTVAAPLFKEVADAVLRARLSDTAPAPDGNARLELKDWPSGGPGEAGGAVEPGKVPELKGLVLKLAIQRVVLAGGQPRVLDPGSGPDGAAWVADQDPAPGRPLAPGAPVTLKAGTGPPPSSGPPPAGPGPAGGTERPAGTAATVRPEP
jgi:cell division protein FtsI (penicillin-binding protein 3)